MNAQGIKYVVDASILRASGVLVRPHAVLPQKCTELLEKILQGQHRAAICTRLSAEWHKHASRRGKQWWTMMQKRGRILFLPNVKNADLQRSMPSIVEDGAREAIAKDLHLLELALATDKIIVSLDEKLKSHVARQTNLYAPARRLTWLGAEPELIVEG